METKTHKSLETSTEISQNSLDFSSSDLGGGCDCNDLSDRKCHKDKEHSCEKKKKLDDKDPENGEISRCLLKPCKKTSDAEKNKSLKNKITRSDPKPGLFESFTSNISNLFNKKN
ncbi:unnamed protein product [Chironomus riparius]|uniref:Uncharacterized protein n=1 Tax=Chironomus riparius TaxID=315576 RepID=A0A9N9RSP2_9DIPT|nr:unnamed protein product [Chironomus riparius]